MKEIKFVPSVCAKPESGFSGHVMFRVPSFDERYEILDEMGLKAEPGSGEIKMEDGKSFAAIRRLVALSEKFYKAVEIKHEDGREFKSFDDLKMDPECDPILLECAMSISRGFRPGKN